MSAIGNHELEGSPFGAYCPQEIYCEGRYLNQTAGSISAGIASKSNTSLYYSINIGLVHFVVLDTMFYLGLPSPNRSEMISWFAADLKIANQKQNRISQPWIIVASHVPMYCSANDDSCSIASLQADLEPLLLEHHVDIFAAGHVHAYE